MQLHTCQSSSSPEKNTVGRTHAHKETIKTQTLLVELTHTQKQLKHRHTKKLKLNLARKVGPVKKESGSEEQFQRGREGGFGI